MTEQRPNILFIVMDALRARNLSCYKYTRKTSPNIDKLAEKGALFEKAFSTNNSTNPSFLSIHSGRHLLKTDFSTFLYNESEMNSFFDSEGIFIQELLKKKGYRTYCLNNLYTWQKRGFDYFWHSANPSEVKIKSGLFFQTLKKAYYYLSSRPGLSFLIKNKLKKEIRSFPRGENATKEAINIIRRSKENKESFFMRIDYDDTHMPYNPGKFEGKFKAEEKGEPFFGEATRKSLNKRLMAIAKSFFDKNSGINDIIAKYDSAISYDDYLIGKVLEELEKTGLAENTYVFFFSDHGESFYEHGIYINHIGLYDDVMNVPLIIAGPGIPGNKKIDTLVTLEDLTPTVLDLLGIVYSPTKFDGQGLLYLINGKKKKLRDSIFLEEIFDLKRRGIRTDKYKYIEFQEKEKWKVRELYDLSADPEEINNLIGEKSSLSAKLEKEMNNLIISLQKINEKRKIKKVLSRLKL